jgi:imidazoleglycerol-phosphate dehydratase
LVKIVRETKETKIEVELSINAQGKSNINTGVGFFDHMLQSFSKHSLIDLNISCIGDTYVDFHHTVEDCAIVIGEALKKEIFPICSVERFGNAKVVMDESCVEAVLDLSNRPFLYFNLPIDGKIGNFDVELVEEFFRALAINSSITLHINMDRGKNKHHIVEAAFKAFAVALRRALSKNESISIPSTKGVL